MVIGPNYFKMLFNFTSQPNSFSDQLALCIKLCSGHYLLSFQGFHKLEVFKQSCESVDMGRTTVPRINLDPRIGYIVTQKMGDLSNPETRETTHLRGRKLMHITPQRRCYVAAMISPAAHAMQPCHIQIRRPSSMQLRLSSTPLLLELL